MKNKQTAVNWFVDQLPIRMKNYLMEEIEKAKEMEENQIVDAHYEGQCDNTEGYPIEISKQYYNEIYGKQTNAS